MKPGWQSTEWWTQLVGWAIVGLAIFGVITPTQGEAFMTAFSKAIVAMTGLVGMIWFGARYLKARTKMKKSKLRDELRALLRPPEEPPTAGETFPSSDERYSSALRPK